MYKAHKFTSKIIIKNYKTTTTCISKTEYCVERNVLAHDIPLVKGANLRYCTFTVTKSIMAFNKQDQEQQKKKVLASISLLFESLMFVILIFT
jgi:hypothetical protein